MKMGVNDPTNGPNVRVIDETSGENLNLSPEDRVEHAKGSKELEAIDGLSINSRP